MNRRFELLLDQTNKRFEQVDKRFEQIDKRFEAMQIQSKSALSRSTDASTHLPGAWTVLWFGLSAPLLPWVAS